MKIKHIITTILLLFSSTFAVSQELTVESFYKDSEELSAVKHQVLDANEHPCALVIVNLPHYQLLFEGDVILSEYKGNNEYWVYMPEGSTWLRIKSPVARPLTFEFRLSLESLNTYYLNLQASGLPDISATNEEYVASFKQDKSSDDAETYATLDENNNMCALVKVRVAAYAQLFEGNIIKILPRTNEYWVYMPEGTNSLEIISTVAAPITYNFDKLKKGRTYIMQLYFKDAAFIPTSTSVMETPSTTLTAPQKTTFNYTNNTGIFHGPHFLGIVYSKEASNNSYEYGIRYGWYDLFIGWYVEGTIASSIIVNDYYAEYENRTTDNSGNIHLIASGMFGGNKFAASFGMGAALGFGENATGGFIIDAGLFYKGYDRYILSFNYNYTLYSYGSGHYLKIGIGYSW